MIRAVGRLPVNQKVLHFCGYSWQALLALLTVTRRSLAVMVALSMILLGAALEFGQRLVLGRASKSATCSSTDLGCLRASPSAS
jgi:hypothetical protein